MVEAPNPHRLHPTSMPYVYKVFEHLDVLWIGKWVHPYTVISEKRGGWIFWNGVWVSLNGIVLSWLRLQRLRQRLTDSTTHIHIICL
jgi:hypothetical protein